MNHGPSSSPLRPRAWACACALLAGNAGAQTSPPTVSSGAAESDATPPVPSSSAAAVSPPPPAPALPSAAAAPQPPPVASPTAQALSPQPEPATRARPLAFRADFKLPFTVTSLAGEGGGATSDPFAAVAQLVLGFQLGRLSVGAGLGFTHFGSSSLDSLSVNELLIAPTLTLDVFESNDRKVAFYVLGAPIFGVVTESEESPASDLGFQFALGATYALHDNFRLGMEVGPVGHFYGTANDDTLSTISLYTALVGTFAYPR